MSDNFVIKRNVLLRDGKVFQSFNSDIDSILELEDRIIVLLAYAPRVGDQNVFCFDFHQRQIWQIPEPKRLHNENYYSAIYLRGLELYAYNINGVEYHIEKETGRFISSELIK